VAGRTAGFAHVRGAGAWLSASPRVQRVAAANIALVLGAGVGGIAMHQPPGSASEPLALASAVGPAAVGPVAIGPVAAVDAPPSPLRAVREKPSRARARPRPKRPAPAPPKGWAYWSVRIRGCESHGRPDAQADYRAKNPSSTASGAYQILDVTWGGRFGVAHASDATPEQQEAAAAELYRRRGTADWAASAACWRAPPR
jgi:hypothetical protein